MANWLISAILILLLALAFNLGLLAYAMYALLAALLLGRYLTRVWAESLAAERECNRLTAEVGDSVAVVVTVENRGWLPIPWVLLEDLLPRQSLVFNPPHLQVEGSRLQLAILRGRGKRTLLYQLRCHRRGYYQVGPLVLETGDLFGLHRRFRVATQPHFLLVYPEVVPLEGYDIASRRPIGEVRMTHRLYEDPTRIAGVRPYIPGDPLNRVNWRATARTGLLHSKVYEPSCVAGATILLDFHQGSHDPRHEPFRSELAITAAASVAHTLYEMGQQVGLITNGRDAADRIRVEGWQGDARTRDAARASAGMLERSDRLRPVIVETRRGPEQFVRILETLARLELTDGLDLGQLIGETSSRLPRDATVVAIVPTVTDATVVMLQSLRRQGYAVTALVNLYDDYDFARAAGQLLAVGIDARQLRDREQISAVCRSLQLQ